MTSDLAITLAYLAIWFGVWIIALAIWTWAYTKITGELFQW